MKKRNKNVLKIVSLLFLGWIIYSCSPDIIEEPLPNNLSSSKIKLNHINLSQLENNNSKVFNKIKNFNSATSQNQSLLKTTNLTNNIIINTDDIVQIQYENKTTYTFPITRIPISNVLENLTVQVNNDGSVDTKIVEYHLSEIEKNAVKSNLSLGFDITDRMKVKTEQEIHIPPIEYPNYQTLGFEDCFEEVIAAGPGCPHNHTHTWGVMQSGGCGWYNANSSYQPSPVTIIVIIANLDCLEANNPGAGSSDPPNGETPNTGNPVNENPPGYWLPGDGGDNGGGFPAGSNGNTPIGGATSNNNGDNIGNTNNLDPDQNQDVLTAPHFPSENETLLANFIANLNLGQQNWWNNTATQQQKDEITQYLIDGGEEAEVSQIIDILDDNKVDNEFVFDAPDVEIDDMEEYLSCFDTTLPATITIYADQPVTGEHDIFSSSETVGHAFISIKQGTKSKTLGFYPKCRLCALIPAPVIPAPSNFIATPGVYGNDEGHTYDTSISITLQPNTSTFTNILTSIEEHSQNGYYNIERMNCTDIAISIGNEAGLNIPNCESPRPWFGQTPGTLGEVIRNMPNQQGVIKNLVGGSAPLNSNN